MKKIFKFITPLPAFLSLPIIVGCSCTEKVYKPYITYKFQYHFKDGAKVSEVKLNNSFDISFELVEGGVFNLEDSWIKIGFLDEQKTYKFNDPAITKKEEGQKLTFTVDSKIVTSLDISIYLVSTRKWNIDTSKSSSDFEFQKVEQAEELKDYWIYWTTKDGKIIDLDNSVINVGGKAIDKTRCVQGEIVDEAKSLVLDYLNIPSYLVQGNIEFELKSQDAWSVSYQEWPEYKTNARKKIAKTSNFTCEFSLYDPLNQMLDKQTAVIKTGDTTLTDSDYTLDDENNKLEIKNEKITGDIYFNIPLITCFYLFSYGPGTGPTVSIKEAKRIQENREYKFKIKSLDPTKVIKWDNADSYLLINGTKTAVNNGWTYDPTPDSEGYYEITVDADHTIGDIVCHFITDTAE